MFSDSKHSCTFHPLLSALSTLCHYTVVEKIDIIKLDDYSFIDLSLFLCINYQIFIDDYTKCCKINALKRTIQIIFIYVYAYVSNIALVYNIISLISQRQLQLIGII